MNEQSWLEILTDSLKVFGDHRTIRFFEPGKALKNGDLDKIIEAGRRAPTDAQGHMYSMIRIVNPELREQLAALCGGQQQIRDAAEFFICCLDVHRIRKLIEHRGGEWGMRSRISLIYGSIDTALVSQNMLIAAESLGYGTCYIGAVQNSVSEISESLHLPEGVLPLFGLCIGVTREDRVPRRRTRVPRDMCFLEDTYPESFEKEKLEEAYQVMSSKRDWFKTIGAYFATGGTMEARESVMEKGWERQGLKPE